MKEVIFIFVLLFTLQFWSYYKTKKRIEKRTQYAYVVTNLITNYLSYLGMKEKVKKYKQIDKFLNARINDLDLLMNAYSFDDISIKKIKTNQRKNIKETKMLINELRNAPLEVNLLFMAFFTISKILFENSRIEIAEGLKIRGKNFIVLMELKNKMLNLVNNTRNVEVSNHKKEELELLHKNNFRIIS